MPGTNMKSIKLGLMPPMTGIVGLYGQEIAWAGQIACAEVNEQGGILGRPLELVIEDDGSLPESSVRAANRLLDHHGCVGLIGNLMTNSRIAVAYRVAEPRRVPYLCFSLYEGSVQSRYYFHFAALPNQQIDLMIPYMRNLYGPKMFFCGNNYEWPRGSVDAAKRILLKVGGQVVGEEYYPLGLSANDASALVENIRQSDATVVAPFFAGSDELTFLSHLNKSGLRDRIQVVMTHFDEVMASHLTPSEREGLYSSNNYFMSVRTPESERYLDRLSKLPGVSGIWPEGNGIVTNFGEGTYLCVKAFAQAANLAGTIDSEAIVDELKSIKIAGLEGTVTMDPNTHHAKVQSYLTRCNANGTFSVVERFGAIAPVIPERYRHQSIDPRSDSEEIRLKSRIVNQMMDGVCLIDANDSHIIYVNPAFEKMTGYSFDEIIGKSISILSQPSDPIGYESMSEINRILYLKGVWRGERSYQRKDGTRFWCSVAISAFTHARFGEVWLANFSDISELKEAENELSMAKRAAEEANRAKDHFLAVLSHELRNPLSPVLTGIELLESSLRGDAESEEILSLIRRNVALEVRLIDDLLDFNRITREKLDLQREKILLNVVLARATEVCRAEIHDKGLKLELDIGSCGECVVDADPARLQQVFWNLIRNAVKFTPSGGVVKISCQFDFADHALIEVIDTGAGIEPHMLSRIFDPFEQGEKTAQHRQGGLGLGLHISRRLIEMHGGTIEAKSDGRGKGSVFRVKIPLAITQKKSTRENTIAPSQRACVTSKILIVEDNEDSALLLRLLLARNGCEAVLADTVQKGIQCAKTQNFNLIISDVGLPDGTGYDLIRELRKLGIQYPAIALSGYGQEQDIRRSNEAGFASHLTKPVTPAKLFEAIEKYRVN